MSEEQVETASLDDRRAEAWFLWSTGWTQLQIALHLGVARKTVQNYLQHEQRARLERREVVDLELERIAGTIEGVMAKAWVRHEAAAKKSIVSLAGSNYLRIVLDAAGQLAHLRGLDAGPSSGAKKGRTQVVVRLSPDGGETRQISPGGTVEVGVQTD